MDFSLTIFNNEHVLQHLTNLSRINVYLIINGNISLLKNNELQHYHVGDVFHIFDFDQTVIFPHHASLLKLSINQHYFYELFQPSNQPINCLNYPSNQLLINALYALHQSEFSRFKHTINLYFQHIFNAVNVDLAEHQSSNSSYGFTLIKSVIHYINTHCIDTLLCKNIAQTYYVNHSFLSREFSKYMHTTLSDYIAIAKITHNAKQLLEQSNDAHAWHDYGFHTYSDYVTRFQHVYHCPPDKWAEKKITDIKLVKHKLNKNIMSQISKIK